MDPGLQHDGSSQSGSRKIELTPGTAVRVGTAGWSIPRRNAASTPGEGSHLERYSRVLACAEINSTFYRAHGRSTYARWAAGTPADFRFSVKVPKAITHECSLTPTREQLRAFLDEVGNLGEKLGPLLFQLPPRQGFDEARARAFFTLFRDLYPEGHAALEPRHSAWISPEAGQLLIEFRVARVVADPPRTSEARQASGYPGLTYYRLHGSPRVYYSSYSAAWLEQLSTTIDMEQTNSDVWCIFDNTASGAAFENALALTHNLNAARTHG